MILPGKKKKKIQSNSFSAGRTSPASLYAPSCEVNEAFVSVESHLWSKCFFCTVFSEGHLSFMLKHNSTADVFVWNVHLPWGEWWFSWAVFNLVTFWTGIQILERTFADMQ